MYYLLQFATYKNSLDLNSFLFKHVTYDPAVRAVLINTFSCIFESLGEIDFTEPFASFIYTNVKISHFVEKMLKFMNFSLQTCIYAIILMDRYYKNVASAKRIGTHVHGLFYTSLLVAETLLEEENYLPSRYLAIVRTDHARFDPMLFFFLQSIDYDSFVSREEYVFYFKAMFVNKFVDWSIFSEDESSPRALPDAGGISSSSDENP